MIASTDVLSNVWWPTSLDSLAKEKAMAVWMNSSPGLLALLAQRTTTEGSWAKFKKSDLENLRVLDTSSLSPSQLSDMAGLYDEMASAEFDRLSLMNRDASRRRLDLGISEIFGLPNLSTLRDLIATEPVVINQRL